MSTKMIPERKNKVHILTGVYKCGGSPMASAICSKCGKKVQVKVQVIQRPGIETWRGVAECPRCGELKVDR